MDWKIRQDRQDDRVWCMEVMLRHEGFLDPRIYECADYCASAGLTKNANDVRAAWEEWKVDNPSDNPQVINRL
ncbi:hypothetical protein S-MbCM25_071 [Synechococcus phage S-MbCM25]|uniref:Uncharacterized protein n=1 Tax=Synechococcus phage S-MbCM25 TaxID=1340811 RepID=V5URU5_9CAUD|nr:hypothetical protein S-MbCM25_071 [Synechococcus phage S-MbCM25]